MDNFKFYKYHALGNDYIVIDPKDTTLDMTVENIRLICHRNFGIGSDGILYGPLETEKGDFGLRIFNPDGSEAEKSGNGLRIFSRYLWDKKLVRDEPFTVDTPGGLVNSVILRNGELVDVEMGRISFNSTKIPVTGGEREVINEKITVNEKTFQFCAASIGNPHCIIPCEEISRELATLYGPHIETHSIFPKRINVQFLKVLDRNNIKIEIWERGAGYTLASGSSSSAAAAVARKLGLCDNHITVHMPGGELKISISDNYDITMTGPVTRIGDGVLVKEAFTTKV
ncbi:diaminopimelate epimerase [candidate division KSB1 bacterium]|nr:diaminopimelate epimerase [candidate division KSB1 bacterium]